MEQQSPLQSIDISRKDSNPTLSRSFSDNHDTDKMNKFPATVSSSSYHHPVFFATQSNNPSLQLQIPVNLFFFVFLYSY